MKLDKYSSPKKRSHIFIGATISLLLFFFVSLGVLMTVGFFSHNAIASNMNSLHSIKERVKTNNYINFDKCWRSLTTEVEKSKSLQVDVSSSIYIIKSSCIKPKLNLLESEPLPEGKKRV